MFAVIEIESKQYQVEEGSIFDVDRIDAEKSKTISTDKVLLLSDGKKTNIGQPYVAGATVELEVLEEYRDKKILVFKFKRKTGYKKTRGHRQTLTRLKVKKINTGSAKSSTKEKELSSETTAKKITKKVKE